MPPTVARCAGIEDGIPCIDIASITEPVPLCLHHQMQVAIAVVPEMLASAASLAKRTRLPKAQDKAASRKVHRARIAALDLSGQHAPRVYFLRNGNRIKIGYTTNLRDRLSTLCLRADSILLLLEGDRSLEAALHEHFAEFRVPGTEWFQHSKEIVRYITSKVPRTPAVVPKHIPIPEPSPTVSRDALLTVIREAMGTRHGVHLSEIVDAQQTQTASTWTYAALRSACEAHAIPVRRNLKINGRNSIGIHRADLDSAEAQ